MSASMTSLQAQIPGSEAVGRWDITVQTPDGPQPSWLEIETSGIHALVGRYVSPVGSARPVSEIHYSPESEAYSFTIPAQWWTYEQDPHFEFTLEDGKLAGTVNSPDGEMLSWTGVRAPSLDREEAPEWGEPVALIDSELSKWIIPENNQFVVEDGVLINQESGGNLI